MYLQAMYARVWCCTEMLPSRTITLVRSKRCTPQMELKSQADFLEGSKTCALRTSRHPSLHVQAHLPETTKAASLLTVQDANHKAK
jgi:hypothetical protein